MALISILSAVSSILIPNPNSNRDSNPSSELNSNRTHARDPNRRSSSNPNTVLQASSSFLNPDSSLNPTSNLNPNLGSHHKQSQRPTSEMNDFDPPEGLPPPYHETFRNNNPEEAQRVPPGMIRKWSETHQCYYYIDPNATGGSRSLGYHPSEMSRNQSTSRHSNSFQPRYTPAPQSRLYSQQSMSQQFLSPMIEGQRRRNRSRDRCSNSRRDDCRESRRERSRDRYQKRHERDDRRAQKKKNKGHHEDSSSQSSDSS